MRSLSFPPRVTRPGHNGSWRSLPRLLATASLIPALAACSGAPIPPSPPAAQGSPTPAGEGSGAQGAAPPSGGVGSTVGSEGLGGSPGASPPAAGQGSPVDDYIAQAAAYLDAAQLEDGSWEYFHSTDPGFAQAEPHARLFATMQVLMNMSHTGFERGAAFARGAEYIRGRMLEGHVWALYEPGAFGSDSWFEPDADDTAVALTILAGTMKLSREEVAGIRDLFDRHRTPEGLYRTYFDGFHGDRGFVPDPNPASLGVNLNILGFFGRYELERSRLLEALRAAVRQDRYWERTPFYRSRAILACLASNAVEHGAAEAEGLLGELLADPGAGKGPGATLPSSLNNLDLAAWIKARSHHCLLTAQPCRDLDPFMMELAMRRSKDGSWDPGPFYEYEVNHAALVAFLERRDFVLPRARGGVAYDVGRALESPGTAVWYDGSRAETTSFGLKALVFYRELLRRRQVFALAPREGQAQD